MEEPRHFTTIPIGGLKREGPLISPQTRRDASCLLKELDKFLASEWKLSKYDVGSSTESGQLRLIVEVPYEYISRCKKLVEQKFERPCVPIEVRESRKKYIVILVDEVRPWWKLW